MPTAPMAIEVNLMRRLERASCSASGSDTAPGTDARLPLGCKGVQLLLQRHDGKPPPIGSKWMPSWRSCNLSSNGDDADPTGTGYV